MQPSQIESNKLTTIRVGAAIAYLILWLVIILILQTNFCNFNQLEKISTLLGSAALSGIFPWLYIKIALNENNIKSKGFPEYNANLVGTSAETLLQTYQHLEEVAVSSGFVNSKEFDENFIKLKAQINSLNNIVKQSRFRRIAFEKLSNKYIQKEFAKKAVENVLSTEVLDEYGVIRQEQKKVRKLFQEDIFQCMRWLTYSLEGGVAANVDKLKSTFVLDKMQIYKSALIYIRNKALMKKFHNDPEILNKVREYIDILVEKIG